MSVCWHSSDYFAVQMLIERSQDVNDQQAIDDMTVMVSPLSIVQPRRKTVSDALEHVCRPCNPILPAKVNLVRDANRSSMVTVCW